MKHICLFLLVCLFFLTTKTSAQSLAINTDGSTANASALLDVKSTTKGVLIPRMSRAERNAIASPATGLLIYQSSPDSLGFHYFDGTRWSPVLSNSNSDLLAWRTGGNTGTIDGSHFIGTSDNVPLNFRVNNQKAGRIDNSTENTFFGYQAANANTSGQHNTAFGHQALVSNLSGTNNTIVGSLAARDNTTGGQNTATGYASMILNTVGQNNTAYGMYSLYQNIAGSNATAIGFQSMLYANSTTTPFINTNVAVGYESLKGNPPASGNTGLNNSAIGYQTLYNNSSGSSNTAVGYGALYGNTSANDNTGVGATALIANTTGTGNTGIGSASMSANTTGNYNTAAGQQSLRSNTTGGANSAYGVQAMEFNTTGSNNTGLGFQAVQANTTGSYNTGIGLQALQLNTTGIFNTALGGQTFFRNTTGSNNTAVGLQALSFNTTADNNTAIGMQALEDNSTGYSNVAIGIRALRNNSTSSNLVAVGDSSLYNATGTGNTALGSKAGYSLTTGSNNVFLGFQAGYNETGNNKLYIANNSSYPPIIYGDFSNKTLGFGTITPNSTYGFAKVEIASEGYLSPSDLLIRNAVNNAGYAPGLVFQHARGTLAAPTTVNNGDYLSAISTMNYDGSNYVVSAGLDIYADGAIAAGIVPTKLQFNTMSTTGSYGARLTIKNDGKVGIGTNTPSARLHVGGGTRFTVLDTGAIFLQSGNTIGSARDWKIAVTLPNGYLSFRDMGFDNTGTGAMATDAMVMAWGTGNVGIATPTPAARLDVAADFKLGAAGTVCNNLLKTNSFIDIPSIPANSETDILVGLAGASVTASAAFASPSLADIEPGIIISWVRVSAANTVKIRFRNTTGSAIDPVAINYVVTVLQ